MIRWSCLFMALLAVVVLFTLRWWGPPTANAFLPALLQRTPVPDAEVSIRHLGLAQSRISVDRVQMGSVTLTDTSIEVDYTLEQLWRRRVDGVTVYHPAVTVDLIQLMAQLSQPEQGSPDRGIMLPKDLPLHHLTIDDASIRLAHGDWQRDFSAGAKVHLDEQTRLSLHVEGDGDRLSVLGGGDLAEGTGWVHGEVGLAGLVGWLPMARELNVIVPDWAEGLAFSHATLTADALLRDAALQPTALDIQMNQPTGIYDQLTFQAGNLRLRNDGQDALIATLADWRIQGTAPGLEWGDIQLRAGDLQVKAIGPWTRVVEGIDPSDWSAELTSAAAPFSFQSDPFHASGDLSLNVTVAAGEIRPLEAIAELTGAQASFKGAHLTAQRANASADGSWPGELNAGLALELAKFSLPEKKLSFQLGSAQIGAELDQDRQPTSLAANLVELSSIYEKLNLKLGKASLESMDASTLRATFSGWSVSGHTPMANLQNVSMSGGDLQARLLGPWASVATGLQPQSFSVELEHASAPVSLFTGLGSLTGTVAFSASIGEGETRPVQATLEAAPGEAAFGGFLLDSARLVASITGQWPGALIASLALEPSTLSWASGAGKLEGLMGELNQLSLSPIAVRQPQTLSFARFQQGELTANAGQLTFTYNPNVQPALMFDLQAQALDGRLKVTITGNPFEPRFFNVNAHFDQVSLESLAALLPKFDGRITGTVSGDLACRIEPDKAKKVKLLPGYLQLTPKTTGRFQYYKQGWLTQNPNLDPVKYVQGKDLLTLMQEPNAATIVNELAMRDLLMTSFRLDVGEADTPKQVIISIEGESDVKGTKVPVVLNIPVAGDVEGLLNLILKIQAKL